MFFRGIYPEVGEWVVYRIIIGQMIYVGITNKFKRRMDQHLMCLERIASGIEIIGAVKHVYRKFNKQSIISHGYTINIYAYCQDKDTSLKIEQRMIIINTDHNISLNVSARASSPN